MSDRYDNEPRNVEPRRGTRWDRGEDRQNFGQDQPSYQNRVRNQMWTDYRDEDLGRTGREYYGDQSNYRQGNTDYNRQGGYDDNRQGNGSDYYRQSGNPQRDWRQGYNDTPHNQRDWNVREPDWQNNRSNFDPERTGLEGPYGTGSQGFGTGYRSGEFSSRYRSGGSGSYTGYGASGQESYYGGSGSYGGGATSSIGSSVSYPERGRFSGKGPKGYQRSDDRIREDVCERLTRHPEIDASEIDVKVTNGEVTLTGTVDERLSKRMAEEVAENISGVKDVHNQMRVKNRETHMESATNKETKEMTGSKTR